MLIVMIVKKRKEWNRDPNTWNGKFYIPYKNPWNRKIYMPYKNTWNGKFFIPCKIDKKKIEEILT